MQVESKQNVLPDAASVTPRRPSTTSAVPSAAGVAAGEQQDANANAADDPDAAGTLR